MKRITIDIYNKSDTLGELIRITSDEYEFDYVNHSGGQGLQCKYKEGTNDYLILGFRLARLADLVKKINSYHEYCNKETRTDTEKYFNRVFEHLDNLTDEEFIDLLTKAGVMEGE